MEMISGMCWVTGYPDGLPTVPNGPCDPIAGSHATIALIGALEHRRQTGEGSLVLSPMVGGALRVTAEQVIEASAYGHVPERAGNRSPTAAPQGLYLSSDVTDDGRRDRWVAISVATDEQWRAVAHLLDDPQLAADQALQRLPGRIAAHDRLDDALQTWCDQRSADCIVSELVQAGVPAAVAVLPHETLGSEQLRAREFFTTVEHAVIGTLPVSGYPMRSARYGRPPMKPSPCFAEHTRAILAEVAGCSPDEIDQLERDGIIGGTPGASKGFTA
jgi:crotonobetainyl-CoA:carnitine CoA-transferase CaiB-like acyl-CoA transferase